MTASGMAPFYRAGGGQAKRGTIPAVNFGMQLPVQAQSTYFVEDWEKDAGADELGAVAKTCDESGFDYVAVCDHVAVPRANAQTMNTTWFDTVATLSWLAALTTRVRLLSHVFVPAYRHPLQTAKAFSTLDALSNGRAILGVGAGHVEAEFDLLGISFADRGKITDEARRHDSRCVRRRVERRRLRAASPPDPARWSADLDRRLLQGSDPARRRTGRRLATARHAQEGHARGHRAHSRAAPGGRSQRCVHRGRDRALPLCR